ncbi:hypothetical protein BDV95DRAFT_380192 [Massariosphaeria phaeospora]|uniref:Uncharacterized protein n=1 Tax=Massariosphaeria phaeospora TaxID=100035 RepID=A0A7C8IEP7_9PLEO|nr:hypothetical protein BDV95DRAFT_380192 [Massariosphaeria phaeospora]
MVSLGLPLHRLAHTLPRVAPRQPARPQMAPPVFLRSGTGGFWKARVTGTAGARAILVGLSAGWVTAVKTALYFLREVFSDFKYTGHNEWRPFLGSSCGMNLLYISASSYMIWSFSQDMLKGLHASE